MLDMIPQIQTRIDELLSQKESVFAAIDGNCTAGKTTLTALLAEQYDCNIFHMDDFFLRPEQRTPARYAQVGGNVDYERFMVEVILPLKSGSSFSYRPFDCAALELTQPVHVTPKKLNIIEGTYSLHPYFGDCYDLGIFLTVSADRQRQRILQRPSYLHKRFFEEWIPMEQAYFTGFSIPAKADLVLELP